MLRFGSTVPDERNLYGAFLIRRRATQIAALNRIMYPVCRTCSPLFVQPSGPKAPGFIDRALTKLQPPPVLAMEFLQQ